MKEEIWKPVVGYEDLYEISSFGRVMSLERIVNNGSINLGRTVGGKLLTLNKRQYNLVRLSTNQKVYTEKVSILVAIAFLGHNKSNGLIVDHIDEDKYNDNVNNLQLITQKENILKANCGEKNSQAKLTDLQAIEIINSKLFGTELGKIYGVTKQCINNIKAGRTFKHLKQ